MGGSASDGQHSTLATPGQLTQHPQGLVHHSHDRLIRVPTLGYYEAWTVQSKGHAWANLSVAILGGLLGPRVFPDQVPACRVLSPRLPTKSFVQVLPQLRKMLPASPQDSSRTFLQFLYLLRHSLIHSGCLPATLESRPGLSLAIHTSMAHVGHRELHSLPSLYPHHSLGCIRCSCNRLHSTEGRSLRGGQSQLLTSDPLSSLPWQHTAERVSMAWDARED